MHLITTVATYLDRVSNHTLSDGLHLVEQRRFAEGRQVVFNHWQGVAATRGRRGAQAAERMQLRQVPRRQSRFQLQIHGRSLDCLVTAVILELRKETHV